MNVRSRLLALPTCLGLLAATTTAQRATVVPHQPDEPDAVTTQWVGPAQMGVIVIDFAGDDDDPMDEAQVEDILFDSGFGGPGPIVDYWLDVSYGLFDVSGEVIGTVDINLSGTSGCEPERRRDWCRAALDAAIAEYPTFDPQAYDLILYVGDSSCNSLGMPGLDPPGAYMDGLSLHALAHEAGHGLGLFHASGIVADPELSFATSQSVEYGDEFDAMGGPTPPAHDSYNQVKRGQLGWIDPMTVATVQDTGPTGVSVDLYPIQATPTGTRIQTLRVPRVNGPNGIVDQYYYVEFNQPSDWDTFPAAHAVNNGILVRLAHDFAGGERSYLFDAVPDAGEPSFLNAPFVPTPRSYAVFQDTSTNTTIEITGITPGATSDDTYATVLVTSNTELECTWGVPSLLLAYPGETLPVHTVRVQNGTTVTLEATLTNNDSEHCMWSALVGTFTSDDPDFDNWGLPASDDKDYESLAMLEATLLGGQSMTKPVQISPPAGFTGSFTVTLTLTNVYTDLSTSHEFDLVVQ